MKKLLKGTSMRSDFLIVLLALMLSACSGVRLTTLQSTATFTTPVKFKTGRVVWIDNHNLPVRLTKRSQGREKLKVVAGDYGNANLAIKEIIESFRQSIPQKLQKQLVESNVEDGNEVVLEVSPTSANFECFSSEPQKACLGGVVRNFELTITLKNGVSGAKMYSIRTESFMTKTKPEDNYAGMIDQQVNIIINTLRNNNWLPPSPLPGSKQEELKGTI